jgi:hypothetical protein
VPGGRSVVGGSIPPSPAFCVDDRELEEEEFPDDDFLLMSTVADADAEFDACAEVAVAVSVT